MIGWERVAAVHVYIGDLAKRCAARIHTRITVVHHGRRINDRMVMCTGRGRHGEWDQR